MSLVLYKQKMSMLVGNRGRNVSFDTWDPVLEVRISVMFILKNG